MDRERKGKEKGGGGKEWVATDCVQKPKAECSKQHPEAVHPEAQVPAHLCDTGQYDEAQSSVNGTSFNYNGTEEE